MHFEPLSFSLAISTQPEVGPFTHYPLQFPLAEAHFVDKSQALVQSAAVAIGAPSGLSFTATEGIISGIRDGKELQAFGANAKGVWYQTSTPISGGSSGEVAPSSSPGLPRAIKVA